MNAAPGEIYRDPVYDGATDPLVVIADGVWWMFYTQRRATHPHPGPGVAWVHGSRIAVAHSADGVAWTYQGHLAPTEAGLALSATPPPAGVTETHWAPEVIAHDGRWWMFLTEIDGVPEQWPGHPRRIVAYTSADLETWTRAGELALASSYAIDASVAHCPDGLWRIWYKDESVGGLTRCSASPDLVTWLMRASLSAGAPTRAPASSNWTESGG